MADVRTKTGRVPMKAICAVFVIVLAMAVRVVLSILAFPIMAMLVLCTPEHPFFSARSVIGDSLTDTEARLGPARKLRRDTGHGRQEWEYVLDLGWAGGLGPDGQYLLLKVSPSQIIEEAEIVYE